MLDIDLQEVAQRALDAGAEAIAINGQRLTSTSTIRTAGGAILVDFRPVTGPYEVAAIGPRQIWSDGSAASRPPARCASWSRSTASRSAIADARRSDPAGRR